MDRRILHVSDLHLESLSDKGCRGLANLIDVAVESHVDMMVVAGDLFDHNSVEDDVVSFAIERLGRLTVPVVILPGNHDSLTSGSVFHREHLWDGQDNIQVFRIPRGETLHLQGLGISLWGKPIVAGNVLPLAGIPEPEEDGNWHIAVAHGYYVGTKTPLFPSYHITHDEIVNSGWDYIAMGHVPTFKCVCDDPVKAYYSGSPSVSGTFAIVDLGGETGVQTTCYSL